MKKEKMSLNPKTIKIQDLVKQLKKVGNMEKNFMEQSIKKSLSILKKQPNVLSLTSPFIVIGDIHGQFYDLLNILDNYSLKSYNLLFLGDYVDRGQFCIEVVTLLMVLKIQHPNSVHLLRGNHECRNMTSEYNFKQQCCKKYSIEMYEKMMDWFKMLPLAAVIDGKYFCVHGGISPNFIGLAELQKVKRSVQIPEHGVICDLLWSDPVDDDDSQWQDNSTRGVSYFFSRKIASQFLKQNNFKMIIRAHELQDEGFKFQESPKSKKQTQKPETILLTLFSAPNYCDKFQNKGAIAIIKNDKICIQTFTQVPHPVVLPGYMDVFEWTLPCITACLHHIVKQLTQQKIKRSKNLQPIEEIVTEMQQYSNSQFIRKMVQKIVVEKNESFPISRIEAVQNKKSFTNALQNIHIPGPFSITFSKLQQKVLKPDLKSMNSFGSTSSHSLDENFINS